MKPDYWQACPNPELCKKLLDRIRSQKGSDPLSSRRGAEQAYADLHRKKGAAT